MTEPTTVATAGRRVRLGDRRQAISTRAVMALAGALTIVAVVAVAALPTGAPTPSDAVPDGLRVIVDHELTDDAHLVLVSEGDRLGLLLATKGAKGWRTVDLERAPAGAVAVWTAVDGSSSVVPFAAVYGRAPGTEVELNWVDGEPQRVTTEIDGAYLAVRTPPVDVASVAVLSDAGEVTLEVDRL